MQQYILKPEDLRIFFDKLNSFFHCILSGALESDFKLV